MIGGLGTMEIVLIFLVILLVFGAKRIPEIAQGIGRGITEFKKAARDVTNEIDVNNNSTQTTQRVQPQVRNELRGQRTEERPVQQPVQDDRSDQS
jgi:sec-independent protein translocase protein TatA